MAKSCDGRSTVAARRRAELVAATLSEAAAARRGRALEELAETLAGMGRAERLGAEVHALAARVRAMVGIERLVGGRMAAEVDVSSLIDRLATGLLIALPSVAEVRTSLACRFVAEPVARVLLASVHEIASVIEAAAGPAEPVALHLASEVERDRMLVAVWATGVPPGPIESGAGALAYARADRLASLFDGEVVSGWRDGGMLVGVDLGVGGGTAGDRGAPR